MTSLALPADPRLVSPPSHFIPLPTPPVLLSGPSTSLYLNPHHLMVFSGRTRPSLRVVWLGQCYEMRGFMILERKDYLAFRENYPKALARALQLPGLEPQYLDALRLEHSVLMGEHRSWAARMREQNISGNPDDNECWLWRGPHDANSRPCVNFPGAHNVPAHRALWLAFKPDNPLGDRRPIRLTDICEHERCCNPMHYAIPRKNTQFVEVSDGSTRRGLPGKFIGYRPTWNATNIVHSGAGQVYVACPNCNQPLSAGTQADYERKAQHLLPTYGRGYCHNCRVKARGLHQTVRKPRRALDSPAATPHEQAFLAEVMRELEKGPIRRERSALPESYDSPDTY